MADATYTLRWIGPADCAGAVEQTLAAVGVPVRRKELRRARGESESRINLMVKNEYVTVDSAGLDALFARAVEETDRAFAAIVADGHEPQWAAGKPDLFVFLGLDGDETLGVGLAASQMAILGRAGVCFDVDLYGGGP